jgi:rod shape-determining protein MreD
MNHLLLASLTYLTLVLQVAVPEQFAIAGYSPAFPLLTLIAAFGIFDGTARMAWCSVIGLACDALSNGPLGREMFAFALVAIFAGQIFGKNDSRSILWALFAGFSLAGTALLFSSAVDVLIAGRQVGRIELLESIGATAAYTAVLAALCRATYNALLRLPFAPIILATR